MRPCYSIEQVPPTLIQGQRLQDGYRTRDRESPITVADITNTTLRPSDVRLGNPSVRPGILW